MKDQGPFKTGLILLFVVSFGLSAVADWELGKPFWPPPKFGTFWSLTHSDSWPPAPCVPTLFWDSLVYPIVGKPGHYVYDDSENPTHSRSLSEMEGMEESNEPTESGPAAYDYGPGDLYLIIGNPTNSEASLMLTSTVFQTYYQLESRPALDASSLWQYGEIVQDTQGVYHINYANARVDDLTQTFFRAVGGNTIASITSHPDYNLAVEPASSTNAAQVGRFLVSLNTNVAYNLTVVYQISGTASNGVDYTNLTGTVTIEANTPSAEIVIGPKFDSLAEFDESVTLSLVLTNGYLVEPKAAVATIKIYDPSPSGMAVAIHDSGWTKLKGLSNTNWNYFVLPESVKEALRSDGTPYVVVSDLDIANGVLLTNGVPKYPIFISLAAEVIRDDEIAALTNYVAAGGFILSGSSSFTRGTNGSYRTNFALANQMGLSCSPSATNWVNNINIFKLAEHSLHRLVSHLPPAEPDEIVWKMPSSAEETSWGSCTDGHARSGPHQIWQVTNTAAQVLVNGNISPYLAIKQYGSGYFIYNGALQPLIAHGGNGPGMYAYLIFRRAIEWAFESAQRPVVKLSPWPYQYDAAFMVRHDLEHFVAEIGDVTNSAQYEFNLGAKGDYYFCTGAITNSGVNTAATIAGLQLAVSDYGATIGPHNGGLPNPRLSGSSPCYFIPTDYPYFHWGPDEAYDVSGGYAYASNSLAISFNQIETWVTNQASSPRVWVVPYFNGTRENSYKIQEQLNIKIVGEQKLTPFPHWTLSTQTDGKRYPLLSEPVSDWFVGTTVAQVIGPTTGSSQHDSQTLHTAVDFYCGLGALINFYSHSLSATTANDDGGAVVLTGDYVAYCMDTGRFPRLWSSNARGVYDWWLKRSTAQITASYGTNGTHSVATVTITGAQDTNTAVEIFAPGSGSAIVYQLRTNDVAATTDSYRTSGELIKVRVGTSVTNVRVEYYAGPVARDDVYYMAQGQTLTVNTNAGMLTNDFATIWQGLFATNASGVSHGSLTLNSDGGFTYTPTNSFWGTECFSYQATDGTNSFGQATVTIFVTKTNGATTNLFSDDFVRCVTGFSPWQVRAGSWSLGGGLMQGTHLTDLANSYLTAAWTNYSVEAQVSLTSGTYGGGLGARLGSGGNHYAAWLYPGSSPGASNVLKLVKFNDWIQWGTGGVNNHVALMETNLPPIGTGWHPLKLMCSNALLQVFYHGTNVISFSDTSSVYSTGSISLDEYAGSISVSNLVVTPIP